MGPPSKGNSKGERAGFLNVSRSAAISETIKKEERTLHRLLQKQIELGRILLPQVEDKDEESGRKAVPLEVFPPADPATIERKLAWLLEARRAAGQPLSFRLDQQAEQQTRTAEPLPSQQDVQQPAGTGNSGAAAGSKEAAREREEAEVREQLRGISRSLWSTLSATATGAGSYSSAARSQYAYRPEAVQAMQREGELSSQHHRRRDAHSAYVEAMARDALLRRGSTAKPPGST